MPGKLYRLVLERILTGREEDTLQNIYTSSVKIGGHYEK
jgi:hypothetical protein